MFTEHRVITALSSATACLEMYHSSAKINVRHHSTTDCTAQRKLADQYPTATNSVFQKWPFDIPQCNFATLLIKYAFIQLCVHYHW